MEERFISQFKDWFVAKYGPISQETARRCFNNYSYLIQNQPPEMDRNGVVKMLSDAGIGELFIFTTDRIASVVLDHFNLDPNGFTWDQLVASAALLPPGTLD
jgi:hypothetical protein